MKTYVAKRILYGLISLFILSVVIFLLTRLAGDPALMIAGPDATDAQLQAVRKEFGLNNPLPVQYFDFIAHALRGNLGISYQYRLPVMEVYFQRLPASIELGLAAFIISILVGLPLGMVSAAKQNSIWDAAGKVIALVGLSLPGFCLSLLLILTFSITLHLLPTSGRGGIVNLIMPAISLSLYFAAVQMRLVRSAMIETMSAEYIRLARSKGLSETIVVGKHALKNAALPVITLGGINLVMMVNTAVVVETIFAWPGIGRLLFEAASNRDFALVQVITLMSGVMVVFMSLLVDILYAYIDPRIRYG